MQTDISSRRKHDRIVLVFVMAVMAAVAFGLLPSVPAPAAAATSRASAEHAAAAGANGTFHTPTSALTPDVDLSAAGGMPQTSTRAISANARPSPASWPLMTSGRWIVNTRGHRVKLAGVNWDGFESADYVAGGLDKQSVDSIAGWIAANGFNTVRIPWSNYMYENDPKVSTTLLRANPGMMKDTHALAILTDVIDALGRHGLMVILDDHQTDDNIWCCGTDDYNGLWYTSDGSLKGYSWYRWLADWRGMAARYANNHAVIGAELRNEVRPTVESETSPVGTINSCPNWAGKVVGASGIACTAGISDSRTNDWHYWAERGGDAVLSANRNLLIFVDGPNYSTDFTGVGNDPVVLSQAHHVVYAPHMYQGFYQHTSSWSTWYSLQVKRDSSPAASSPAATEFNPGGGNQPQLLAFVTGPGGQVYEKRWSEPNGPWTQWYVIGGNSYGGGGHIVGSPAVAAFGQQVEVFGRGPQGQVWGNVWTLKSGKWSGWYPITGERTNYAPAVTEYQPPNGPPELLVFVRGTDNNIYEKVYTTSAGWTRRWHNIDAAGVGSTTGPVSAASFGQDQVQLFAQGTNHAVYQTAWTYPGSSGWSAWSSLGGQTGYPPSASAFGPYQMQVFARGANGQVFTDVWTTQSKQWTGSGSWSGWQSIGGGVAGAPAAVAFGDQMQVFAQGTNTQQVYADRYQYNGFPAFSALAGADWGYILKQGERFTAPLWISEWGACTTLLSSTHCGPTDADFFDNATSYLRAGDIDFAYWQLGSQIFPCSTPYKGCQARQQTQKDPGYDYFGLLQGDWKTPFGSNRLSMIEALEGQTQGP